MKWSESQKRLRSMALSPSQDSVSLNIVLCDGHSGVTTAVRSLARAGEPGRRVLALNASGPWEAVITMCEATGQKLNCALGYTGNIVRCLRALNPDGSNPGLTLMLQDAHLIRRARDLQRLVSCLEWAAEDSGSLVRAMLLCNKVARWNPQSCAFELEWKSTWWRWAESEGGDGRLKKADVWHFTRRTLTAVKEEIAIPLLERASA